MWSLSPAAASALKTSHTVAWKLEALLQGQVIYTTTTGFLLDGSVTGDATAATWRTLSCSIVDPFLELMPFLDIYGQELRVSRGVRLSTGSEVVPVGCFGLTDVEFDRAPAPLWRLKGMDRSDAVRTRKFSDPYVVVAGTNYGTAIQALLRSRVPWLPFSPADFSTLTSLTTPLTVLTENSDPWGGAVKMAQAIGMDLFADAAGTIVMRQTPSASTTAVVWDFIEGTAGTVVSSKRHGIQTEVFSGVVVTGESTGLAAGQSPVRATVWDTDPTSPTWYLGPFGARPYFYTSPLITSSAQALAAATSLLRQVTGRAVQTHFEAVPQPALGPSDVLHVAGGGLDEVQVLESYTLPLNVTGTQTMNSRLRTAA